MHIAGKCFLLPVFRFIVFLLVLPVGCGGGGNGTNTSELSFSHKSAAPGTFVAVNDDSIKKGKVLSIRLTSPVGLDFTSESFPTENGSAKFVLPPFIDYSLASIDAGLITVTLPNGKSGAVRVELLPDLADVEPGFVLKEYLGVELANLNDLLVILDEFQAANNFSTEDMKAQVQVQIDDLSETLDELNATGLLTVSTIDSDFPLSMASLKQVDQLLYAMSKGVFDELNTPTQQLQSNLLAQANLVTAKSNSSVSEVVNVFRNLPVGIADDVRTKFEDSTILAQIAWMKIWVHDNSLGFGDDAFSTYVDAPTQFVQTAIVGLFQQAANIFVARRDGQDVVVDKGVRDTVSTLYDRFAPDQVKELYDHLTQASIWADWAATNFCKANSVIPEKYRLFCDQAEKNKNILVHSSVSAAIVSPAVINSGDITVLTRCVSGFLAGANYARTSEVTVDWGDGSFIVFTQVGQGCRELDHMFVNDGGFDEFYTVTVSVVGDNDLSHVASKAVTVTVKSVIEPLTVLISGPSKVDLLQTANWAVKVEGGVSPYVASIDWGDAIKQMGRSQTGTFKGRHTYSETGTNTIFVTVDDSSDFFAEDTLIVNVVDEAEPSNTGLTILSYRNFSGNIVGGPSLNKDDADIQLVGVSNRPTISWPGSITYLAVIGPTSELLYSAEALTDENGDEISFFDGGFTYGDRMARNDVEWTGADPSPALISGQAYTINIYDDVSEQLAQLVFSID